MTTTTNPTAEAEELLVEAAGDLTCESEFTRHPRHIDFIDAMLQGLTAFQGSEAKKAWDAFTAALDKAHARWSPCGTCEGEGQVPQPCCTGPAQRIECGCGGQPISDDCPACNGQGWEV